MRKVNLGKVVNIRDSEREPLNKKERQEIKGNGTYPYIGANGIVDWVDEFLFDEKILCIAEDGGAWGKNEVCTQIYNEKCWVNNHAHVVTAKENVLTEYLSYYLNYQDLNSFITGTTRGKLNQTNLKKIEIPLPSLSEQKAIVAKLDRAQRLIDIDKEMLAKYDELIQSVFLEMFGDPVTNPKGWEVKKLGKILENKDSDRIPVKKSDRKEMAGDYPYYGASGIVDYVDDYLFEGPNLLIGEDGANLLSRSTDIAFIADGKYWVNNHAHVLGSDRIELLHYVMYFINNLDLEPYITGSAQPKLNQGNLNKIEVPIPDDCYIKEFERKLYRITTEITATEIGLKRSKELFSSLVQGAFG